LILDDDGEGSTAPFSTTVTQPLSHRATRTATPNTSAPNAFEDREMCAPVQRRLTGPTNDKLTICLLKAQSTISGFRVTTRMAMGTGVAAHTARGLAVTVLEYADEQWSWAVWEAEMKPEQRKIYELPMTSTPSPLVYAFPVRGRGVK